MRIKLFALIFAFISFSCNITKSIDQPTCEVLNLVYTDFLQRHKNEFKYMKFERHYICNFNDIEIDPAIKMDSVFKYIKSPVEQFDITELQNIGQKCLEIPEIIQISHDVAIDSLRFSKNAKKAIWGITNLRKTDNYYYLIFSLSINSRTVIGDEYLLEMKNGKPIILNVNPISS